MAFFQCNFKSQVLNIACSMNVIIPQLPVTGDQTAARDYKFPVVYLLHGLSDDHSCWQRYTSVERYANDTGLAVVMPAANRSFYANIKDGERYWDYIAQEVPALSRQFFNLSDKREDNYAAGLSMGGYGAFKLALTYPNQFAAAASLSGSLDMVSRYKLVKNNDFGRELSGIFGSVNELEGSENDLMAAAGRLAGMTGDAPRLYQWCGTEDFLYNDNIAFRNHIQRLRFELTYEECAGDHSWKHWDEKIRRVFEWFGSIKG